jgi:hypothetical protein
MDSLLPFLLGSCIPYNMPVYPGALRLARQLPSAAYHSLVIGDDSGKEMISPLVLFLGRYGALRLRASEEIAHKRRRSGIRTDRTFGGMRAAPARTGSVQVLRLTKTQAFRAHPAAAIGAHSHAVPLLLTWPKPGKGR